MALYLYLYSNVLLFLLSTNSGASDPHESISKRTPLGVPYYFESVHLASRSLYTTTALILLEYMTVNISSTLQSELQQLASTYNDKQELLQYHPPRKLEINRLSSQTLHSCAVGNGIFNGIFLGGEEAETFYEKLQSSCFANKIQLLKDLLDLYGNDSSELLKLSLLECKSRKIPDSLVTPHYFKFLLGVLVDNYLLPNDFQLSMPFEDLSVYYKARIASCAFTDTSFIVGIQIPVISKDVRNSMQSHKLIPIPLWMPSDQNTVCHLQDGADSDFPEDIYLTTFVDKEAHRESELLCDGSLCFIPNQDFITTRSMRRNCVQAIIEAQDEDMVCKMKCEPAGTFNFPIIREVASDRYLLVADLKSGKNENSSQNLRVECPPFQKEEVLTFPATGALEIILPCECHIRYKDQMFKARSPCGAEFSKVPILFPGSFENREATL